MAGIWASTGATEPRPVAVTLERAVELLRADPTRVAAAAGGLVPYVAADGTPKYSLRLLARELDPSPMGGSSASRARPRQRARKRTTL